MKIALTRPQFDLVSAEEQFPCLCGGYGSGKSQALIVRALIKKFAYPKQTVAFYMPTFDLCRTVGFPRFAEQLDQMRVKSTLSKSLALIDIKNAGQILFRTMDTPERIVGFEAADSVVDELDTLAPDKAADAWNRIIARNRQKKPDGTLNTVAVGTTPEGFRFVYNRWWKNLKPGYRLIRASTASNARNLPAGYIDSLRESYPSNLLAAYLDGEFVNLTSGSVYPEFKRDLNATQEIVLKGEPLHVGMDFNVTKMAAVIYVLRNDEPHAVDEIVDGFDTPAMIKTLNERYRITGAEHPIMVYPDASGKARKSENASSSDIALLQQAKFSVFVNPSNPLVKDRVLATNALILKESKRRLRVNPDKCPHFVEGLEKQAYDKNGEPDKSTGLDHVTDAGTYPLAYRWPIKRPAMSIRMGVAR